LRLEDSSIGHVALGTQRLYISLHRGRLWGKRAMSNDDEPESSYYRKLSEQIEINEAQLEKLEVALSSYRVKSVSYFFISVLTGCLLIIVV
jgi:4-hydroxyphenylpyruvate dioxygenase-like putative hemolysin